MQRKFFWSYLILSLSTCISADLPLEDNVPFGFSHTKIKAHEEATPGIVRHAIFTKAAVGSLFVGAAGWYIYRTWHKYQYWTPPNQMLEHTITKVTTATGGESVTDILILVDNPWKVNTSSLGLMEWISSTAKGIGEVGGEYCAQSLLSYYGGSLLSKYMGKVDNKWFLLKQTDIKDLLDELAEDILLLPLVEEPERGMHRIEVIRAKIEYLVSDCMKFIGYLKYRQERVLEEDTLRSVSMQNVIDDFQQVTIDFCFEMDTLVKDYGSDRANREVRLTKAVELEGTITHFTDEFYANLKAFDLYERKGT